MMGKQSEIFIHGEGQAWFDRNKDNLPVEDDPIIPTLVKLGIKPKRVLEVGCSNGWRLEEMRKTFKCRIGGIDPMITDHKFVNGGFIGGGTADHIHYPSRDFDMVVYGFCLYLCDPDDYLRIASEGDRVLTDGGHIVIYDFFPHLPHSRKYKHRDGVLTRKMDWAKLWLGYPAYSRVITQLWKDETAVTVLKKNLKDAFPLTDE